MRKLILALLFTITSEQVLADVVVGDFLESPEMIGSGEFRAMFLKIYEAELYAEESEFSISEPFALKLIYARKIPGEGIVDRTIKLIRRQGVDDELQLAAWHTQLDEIFPDVKKGTEIVGTHGVGEGATFYVDGERVGSVSDPELCKYFFDIWLSEDTVAPDLRSDLLGLASAD